MFIIIEEDSFETIKGLQRITITDNPAITVLRLFFVNNKYSIIAMAVAKMNVLDCVISPTNNDIIIIGK